MRFIETVLIKNAPLNLHLHNKRMNTTRKKFFSAPPIDLRDYIKPLPFSRVRVTYGRTIRKIEYFRVQKREFNRFKVVFSNIEYSYKYEDRKELNSLKAEGFDEVIIIKNSLVTDTTISNLAFFDGKKWYTPKKPLLKGTKREELLKKGILTEAEIKADDLKYFEKFAMLNAVIGFYVKEISCISY